MCVFLDTINFVLLYVLLTRKHSSRMHTTSFLTVGGCGSVGHIPLSHAPPWLHPPGYIPLATPPVTPPWSHTQWSHHSVHYMLGYTLLGQTDTCKTLHFHKYCCAREQLITNNDDIDQWFSFFNCPGSSLI